MIDSSGGELERFAYVIGGELGEVNEDLPSGHALRDQADQRGDRDAGPPDARHARHDSVIGDDPLEGHGTRVTAQWLAISPARQMPVPERRRARSPAGRRPACAHGASGGEHELDLARPVAIYREHAGPGRVGRQEDRRASGVELHGGHRSGTVAVGSALPATTGRAITRQPGGACGSFRKMAHGAAVAAAKLAGAGR